MKPRLPLVQITLSFIYIYLFINTRRMSPNLRGAGGGAVSMYVEYVYHTIPDTGYRVIGTTAHRVDYHFLHHTMHN